MSGSTVLRVTARPIAGRAGAHYAEGWADLESLILLTQVLAEATVEGRKPAALELKVSEKGAVSAYALGRFPVTLYHAQWVRLLEHSDELEAFLEENTGKLKLRAQE
jgi:hypothetical protein